ncbi:response regulator [Pseudobacteriovorax antillogorgiicola]|uniref:Response regulator receiver domain-containing protein n=1 Tax=Pseudobacteriovorax antillogorgiicola TaxID=1513793 RepID=A0A1Y6BSZ9_9BACT|nr:response regulator [Pseudobacteriovorax antillogorgiicola]TCS54675.1 response regulator receiver domain-containing protein [Pseudobacteriovorax antillogorgiicola]SMF16644.1 Response regulator receiver domain-containing protein [Pseudobacteriovorax antillogorgiicola]
MKLDNIKTALKNLTSEPMKVKPKEDMKKAILLDDDSIFCKLLKKDVEDKGNLQLETTCSVETFLSMVKLNNYDVCLIDYDLYETTGVDVIHRMREFSNIPALLISSSQSVIRVDGSESHFDDFLSKWSDPEEIVEHSLELCRENGDAIAVS